MPGPEDKIVEYGEGVLVTAAMLNEIRKSTPSPWIETNCQVSEEGPTLADIVDRLDRIERLLKLIFDGHVLIGGQFRKITP